MYSDCFILAINYYRYTAIMCAILICLPIHGYAMHTVIVLRDIRGAQRGPLCTVLRRK